MDNRFEAWNSREIARAQLALATRIAQSSHSLADWARQARAEDEYRKAVMATAKR